MTSEDLNYSLNYLDSNLSISIDTELNNIDVISEYVGQDFNGRADLLVDSNFNFKDRNYEVNVDAKTNDFTVGIAYLDNILTGPGQVSGKVNGTLDASQFNVSEVKVSTKPIDVFVEGNFSSENIFLQVDSLLHDSSKLVSDLEGEVGINGIVNGSLQSPQFNGAITSQGLQIFGIQFENIDSNVSIKVDLKRTVADIQLTGVINENQIESSVSFAIDYDEGIVIDSLNIEGLDAVINGQIAFSNLYIGEGEFTVQISDLAQIGAITQLDIGGTVDSKITFSNLDNLQNFMVEAIGTNFSIYGFELESIEIKGETENLYSLLDYNLSSTASTQERVQTGSSTLDVQASANQGSTEVSIIGELKSENELFSFSVMESTLRQQSYVFPIRETARIIIQDGKFEIENASWQVGDGILQLSGDTANTLFVNLSDIPLDITKIFFPQQMLVGILNGELELDLNSDTPQIVWDLSISQSNGQFQENLVNSVATEGTAFIIQNQITAKTDVSLQSLDFIPILDEQNLAGKFEVEFEIAPIFAGNDVQNCCECQNFWSQVRHFRN